MSVSISPDLKAVKRHARIRWSGVPLLLSGLTVVGLCVAQWLQQGSGYIIFIALMGMGMGLASFGANHEATMAFALRVKRVGQEALPEKIETELQEECDRNADALDAIQPFPRTSVVLPFVALGIQAFVAWYVIRSY